MLKKLTFISLLLFLLPLGLRAQGGAYELRGQVLSESGEPLIGATVIRHGPSRSGTLAGDKGYFSINVAPGDTITVSMLSYEDATVPVAGRRSLVVRLKDSSEYLESVVLIVAAVPEGLPTIVAISLSINALKLARENALIKRLVVAETAGCVSVICSDKTGTLTCNRMEVTDLCSGKYFSPGRLPDIVRDNIIANTAAEVVSARGKHEWSGSPTECALLRLVYPSPTEKLGADRVAFMVTDREEFTSEKKYSSAKTHKNGHFCIFYKGAFEKISAMCDFDKGQYAAAKNRADYYASNAK